ncbi:MAG TPA: mobile mystery protein A [Allosphingosinicella sp.]|nr:mobile mystery protein A [Allosphingosinicella sp.]
MDSTALARRHLERRLAPLRGRQDLTRPPYGWLRAIRDALGMTTRQLARRMGKVQSAIVDLEKSEAREAISLAKLREAAAAMDCTLVYAIVPNRPIDEVLRARAEARADNQLARVSHTMALENQGLDQSALAAERERLVEELLRGSIARLWDDKP